jgi:hypothetical protein
MADEQTSGKLREVGGEPIARQTKTGEELGEVVEGLVAVFDSQDESEAMVVKGLLESAGINAVVNSIDTQQDLFPGVGGVVVLVNRDQVDDARQVITAGQRTQAEDVTPGAA